MKKAYIAPAIDEIDFKDTAYTCGVSQRQIVNISGKMRLGQPKCFSLTSWLESMGSFSDDEIVITEEEE
jgi:hypothetical protein